MTGARLKKTPEKIAIIRELAPTATASEISRVIGVSLVTAIKWAADEVIPLMTRSQARKKAWADPEVRARMSEASKKALADPEVRARIKASRRGAKGILIPKWVPLDLHDEFLEIAAFEGEEAAASHVRRLKREMVAA